MYEELVNELLSDPQKLIQKKPFTRGFQDATCYSDDGQTVGVNCTVSARLPRFKKEIVSQETFMKELDPNSHAVLFDENIPSLSIKTKEGGYVDVKFSRCAIPFQRIIKNKQVLHLTGHKMQFSLIGNQPSEKEQEDFAIFKQYWDLRNQDGMKNKMVDAQKSYGDAGLLYYFDYDNNIKSRLLSFEDGYVLCPHNDQNGDRILESVYYVNGNVEYIDSYDRKYMYRYTLDSSANGGDSNWVLHEPVLHGFDEIPLITKRGNVAWNDVQHLCSGFELLYNVFMAIQRRHGWGLLYVKGKFKDSVQKIAGSVILNDTSLEGKGDAKFLTPPDPQGYLETLSSLFDHIQLGSSTTFLLPKDIKFSGDISGIAIQLTQNLDINNALLGVIEWQNVADKMVRLFKYGLAKELVDKKINKQAITDFQNLNISGKFKVWRPMNDYEYNQMLTLLVGGGILSKRTGTEKNTESTPDEEIRLKAQRAEEEQRLLSQAQAQANAARQAYGGSINNNNNN